MDIKSFGEELYQQMIRELGEVEKQSKDVLERESHAIEVIRTHTYALKNFIHDYSFGSQAEEIEFFKNIKPMFVSQLLYHNELFEIEVTRPLEKEPIMQHYSEALRRIQAFVASNMELYKYYRFGSTYLDTRYFLSDRTNETATEVMYDPAFCTPFDHKFCIIKAYEMLKENLTQRIANADRFCEDGQSIVLQWTGSKAALIELIYALQLSGVFNKSECDIKMIAVYFEKMFQVNLGNYYRTYKDIQIRKTGKTLFLDELREKLSQRLDDSFA